MRQAGRSLPEYRAIRERHSFFEVAETPELCAEVTLEPVRRHGVDAAVIFADIMSPVRGMGVDVELVEGVGPVVERRIESMADVERLHVGEPEEWGGSILDAIRIVRSELDPGRAVVGFCGAPFTVAGYLVEGKPSRDFVRTKTLMYREPSVWHALMERLTEQSARYVAAKVEAGADVIQLFDSWVGALSPADYAEFVEPYSARILAAVDVPTIHFGTGAGGTLLELLARAGGDVIGLDWRVPLDIGWSVAGSRPRRAGQPRTRPPARPVGARGSGDARRARPRRRPPGPYLQPGPRRPAADRPRRARTPRRARRRPHRCRGTRVIPGKPHLPPLRSSVTPCAPPMVPQARRLSGR